MSEFSKEAIEAITNNLDDIRRRLSLNINGDNNESQGNGESVSLNKRITGSTNILLYGVPGCGKSHKVEEEYESKITTEKNKIRVVFHPDYTYSDFVGQLLPVLKEVENAQGVKEEKLQYEFVLGPFTQILKTAYAEPDQQCLLIIEELNRGNAPAIFGEIFQLLDRNDDGKSKYSIYNRDISMALYDEPNKPIELPPNLTIVATMNTSDQNVFTMDTAFQRRWQMKHIPNRFTGESLDEKTINHVAKHLPNSEISWGVFAQTVNKKCTPPTLALAVQKIKALVCTSPRTTIWTMQSALRKRCSNTCGTMLSSWAERNSSMTAAKVFPL